MKKIFCILSILTIISPAFADDPAPATPVAGEPTSVTPAGDGTLATNNGETAKPGYNLVNANVSTDGNAASAGYVKGAYNATIKAVNTVASIKQDKITSSNKLSADLVEDGTTNKVVTATDKNTWNGKQNQLSSVANPAQNQVPTNGQLIQSAGQFVTSVSAANGGVTVARGEITIPTSNPNLAAQSGRAAIWIE